MEENNINIDENNAIQETPDACADGTTTSCDASAKGKLKAFWGKIKTFFEKHENLRQMVMFILFSFVCFAVEKILFFALKYGLEKSCGETPLDWFIFHYNEPSNALNAFVAFIVSQVVAQACTFLLNRKKTFHAQNNILIAGTIYAVFTVGLVLFNVYLGGVVPKAITQSMGGSENAAAKAVGDIVGQVIVSFSAFVISFCCNKLLAVLNFGKKKTAAQDENADSPSNDEATSSEDIALDANNAQND